MANRERCKSREVDRNDFKSAVGLANTAHNNTGPAAWKKVWSVKYFTTAVTSVEYSKV